MPSPSPARLPRATYRVQLNPGFPFAQLAAIVPYLDALGVSDVYASPIFRAAPGSQHGYDVCDPNEVNPELGGMEGLEQAGALLRERGMGLLLDFVPNHMGIEGPHNWRWLDVLENGLSSRYAPYFDIEWNPRQSALQERIQVPMLHDFYGRVLEAGEIQLRYLEGAFWVCYRSLRFPLRPESYPSVLQRLAWFKNPGSSVSQKLEALARQFRALPKPATSESLEAVQERNRRRDALRQQLARLVAEEKLESDLDEVLQALNGAPGQPVSFDNLHQILEEQHYRLAYWKSGSQEINYRRFFAVDTLVGLHMERPEVFDDTHRLLRYLIEREIVTGVRVDHIDGLWDPEEYLERLALLGREGKGPLYLLVEKILAEGEELPPGWRTHGTSGYDFTASLVDLFIDWRRESEVTKIYRDFTGLALPPQEQIYPLKLFIIEELFSNAIESLADELEARVKADRLWCDLASNDLRVAIAKLVACLPVYRTYRRIGHRPSPADVAVVDRALAEALRLNPSSDPTAFRFVRDLWAEGFPDPAAPPELRAWAGQWIAKLQQFTGAITAKSVEDTLFYRHVRLFAANEVGHGPAAYGGPAELFHRANRFRAERWPAGLLATSTHDTKMSEDVRARLLALSGLPSRWEWALREWSELNHGFKTKLESGALAPDANEEYLLYQILLGAWPLDPAEGESEGFRQRIKEYMRKAMSESKANTTWSTPNEAWLKACADFIDAILDRARDGGAFLDRFRPFAEDLAWRGMNLSLAQVALKLTVPGVPDFYQGNELWDFSLVDPDNRRPVDFDARIAALRALDGATFPDLIANWKDGRLKLHATRALLHRRRERPDFFARAIYVPVALEGLRAERFVAFLRATPEEKMLVLAFRYPSDEDPAVWPRIYGETQLALPEEAAGVSAWTELLSGREVPAAAASHGRLPVDLLLRELPVGVFWGSAAG